MNNIHLPIAVHVFLVQNNKILLLKRKNTGYQDGQWSIPAGRLNSDESIRLAAIREVQEETSMYIEIHNLSKPLTMQHKDNRGTRLYFFFQCDKWTGEPINNEPQKCSEIKWFEMHQFPDSMVPYIKTAWQSLQKQACYLEYGF